jgi:hypothetical protein
MAGRGKEAAPSGGAGGLSWAVACSTEELNVERLAPAAGNHARRDAHPAADSE